MTNALRWTIFWFIVFNICNGLICTADNVHVEAIAWCCWTLCTVGMYDNLRMREQGKK